MSCRLDPARNSQEAQTVKTSAWTAFLTVCRNKPVEEHHMIPHRRHHIEHILSPARPRQQAYHSVSEHNHPPADRCLHSPSSRADRTASSSLQRANYVTDPPRPTSTPLSSLVATVRLSTPPTRERRAYTSGFTSANLREGRRETAVGLWPVPAVLRPKPARRPPN